MKKIKWGWDAGMGEEEGEWLMLVLEAKHLGIKLEDIREFLSISK